MKNIYVFAKRNLKEIWRDPLSLIFLFGVPVLMLILFYFAFHNLTYQFEIRLLAPSMVGFASSFISLFMGLIIAEDRNSTFLTRLYSTPLKSYQFIFGYLVSIIPLGLLQSILILGIACILDFSFFSWTIILAILCNLLICIFYISFGILLGCVCSNKSVGGASSILIMGQSILSGMWFPLDGMDKSFIAFLDVLPFKNGSDLMINICAGKMDVIKNLLILISYIIVVLIIAIIVYRAKMKKR